MAQEPITLFARIADPAGVSRYLRKKLGPYLQIDGTPTDWRKATVTLRNWWKKRTLTITHDPDYYSEPNWSKQLDGMRGYLAGFPDTERKTLALTLTTTFRFSLGTIFDPDPDSSGDERLELLFAIAEMVDGVLFTPSSLRDARGRVLFGAGGEDDEDAAAVWPRVVGEVSIPKRVGAEAHEASRPMPVDEPREGPDPPSVQRVVRRALALTAVTIRGILEQDRPGRSATATHKELAKWIDDLGIGGELEPDEWMAIQRPPGLLDPQAQIDSTWRLEGLVVLAWALGQFEIPPHDQLVDFHRLWKRLGWRDLVAARRLLENPTLRSRSEINALCKQLFAIHWRLRNYHLHREVLDFPEFARTCWFGPLDLTGLPLVDGDLAIGGVRLDQAKPHAFDGAHSTARERHQAANWLREGPEWYADASVAT